MKTALIQRQLNVASYAEDMKRNKIVCIIEIVLTIRGSAHNFDIIIKEVE